MWEKLNIRITKFYLSVNLKLYFFSYFCDLWWNGNRLPTYIEWISAERPRLFLKDFHVIYILGKDAIIFYVSFAFDKKHHLILTNAQNITHLCWISYFISHYLSMGDFFSIFRLQYFYCWFVSILGIILWIITMHFYAFVCFCQSILIDFFCFLSNNCIFPNDYRKNFKWRFFNKWVFLID